MTPFEMACTIRNDRDSDQEDVNAFVLRHFAKERMSDLGAAIDLLISWERANEEFANLLGFLKKVERKTTNTTIKALVERKRQLGYDAKFEALMQRQWRCPHCKTIATISEIEFPIGAPSRLPRCVACGQEGIAPSDGKPQLASLDGGKTGLRPLPPPPAQGGGK